jgi:hypothetical protein
LGDNLGDNFSRSPLVCASLRVGQEGSPVCTENLGPDVMVMKSTKNRV